jgi:hypothetical protein
LFPEYFKIITIVPVQPIVSTKPHKAAMILVDTSYRIIGKSLVNAEVPDGERLTTGLFEYQAA